MMVGAETVLRFHDRKEVSVGLLDGLKGKAGTLAGKATELIGDNSDKVKNGIGKAGDFVDGKTHGKYSHHIDGVQTKASEMVDQIDKKDGKGDVGPTPPPAV
ncbi:uncharacterized protein YjbJ (UPF0337 family) [Arthrobacter agilis]|jgi:hypothetical protein|nr:uncharacterized protein YjbJ (UPF0337 family) [Arthrobacter agilis]